MSRPVMRHLKPRDVPAILQLAQQQNERDGTNYPVPVLYNASGQRSENVPLALVAEDKGQVLQAQVWLRTTELMVFGTHPRATEVSHRHIDWASFLLKEKGYDSMHCFVPHERVPLIAPIQDRMRFSRVDERLAHFYRSLEGD